MVLFINIKDIDENTSLMMSIYNEYDVELFELLINDSDIELTNNKNKNITKLVYEKYGINSELFEILMNHKKINIKNFNIFDLTFIYNF